MHFVLEYGLEPVRGHLGILDDPTGKKIYALANYLRGFKGSETKPGKITYYEITETS